MALHSRTVSVTVQMVSAILDRLEALGQQILDPRTIILLEVHKGYPQFLQQIHFDMSPLERHHTSTVDTVVLVKGLHHVVQQLQIHGIFFGSAVERQGMHMIAYIVHRLLVLRRQARVRHGQFKMNAFGNSVNGAPPNFPRHESF